MKLIKGILQNFSPKRISGSIWPVEMNGKQIKVFLESNEHYMRRIIANILLDIQIKHWR